METKIITKKEFDSFPAGEIFGMGILPNSPEGLFMTNNGGELKWIAKKGYADDWCIYCHWSYNSLEFIANCGDKVTSRIHIERCVPCDDEVFKCYRF